MRFDVLTIFPEMFSGYFSESIISRAQKKKLLTITAHDLRKWATDKHHKVDDKPYGGGPGMVFKVEPIFKALKALHAITPPTSPYLKGRKGRGYDTYVILTSARGKQFTQADAKRLAKYKRVVILCGRYEGVDERVAQNLVDEEFSIGPYILTGGELPAMVMIDAISRQVPGVLGKQESLEDVRGSFPQYTRPEKITLHATRYKVHELKVPKVLLSGDHKRITEWRKKHGG